MTGEGPASAVIVRISPIHGTGLFAARDIASGEILCEYRGARITKDESHRRSETSETDTPVYRVSFDDDTDIDGDIPDNPAKFANHGCEANAELVCEGDRLWLVSCREIPDGSEILFDYGFGLAESLSHPCRCGTPGCVGRILASPLRPLLKKHLRRNRVR